MLAPEPGAYTVKLDPCTTYITHRMCYHTSHLAPFVDNESEMGRRMATLLRQNDSYPVPFYQWAFPAKQTQPWIFTHAKSPAQTSSIGMSKKIREGDIKKFSAWTGQFLW